MRKSLEYLLITAAVICFLFIAAIFYIYNNINILVPLSCFENFSTIKPFALKRIFVLSTKKDITSKMINDIENGDRIEFNSCYLRLIGAIGDKRALPVLTEAYVKCQPDSDEPKCITIQYGCITALGLIGDESNSFFLETILKNYDRHPTQVRSQIYARSLYLMTGKQYKYKKDDGTEGKLELWDSIIKARRIIEETKGRQRSVNEMISLYESI